MNPSLTHPTADTFLVLAEWLDRLESPYVVINVGNTRVTAAKLCEMIAASFPALTPDQETEVEVARGEIVEGYIGELSMESLTDREQALIAGNIRGFAAWMESGGFVEVEDDSTPPGYGL